MPLSKVPAAGLLPGAVSERTIASTGKVTLISFPNTSAYPNGGPPTTLTLTEAQAPIGSYVCLSVEVFCGNSSGDQYMYLYQRADSISNMWIGVGIDGWFFYDSRVCWFYIGSVEDRTFVVHHATVNATNVNDTRRVCYHGYHKVTQ